MGEPSSGIVYLVGAGPGDPGLVTVRGVDCLRQADTVIYDYLANPVLLDYAPEQAERIYVGKRTSCHTLDQDGINALIVAKAKEGKVVVRLKGGDPFMFGRGGEEAAALVDAGLPFEVVPGVTSGIAAPAYAGIPLTMRGVNSAVAFVTGHDSDAGSPAVDWAALARMQTVVFYMGLKNLRSICEQLVANGMTPETPCAVIHRGTFPTQRTATGTLADIVQRIHEQHIKTPSIVVVGDVVSMRDRIAWFEHQPLFGRRIVVTRAKDQAGTFSSVLRGLGADVVELPVIRTVPPESWAPLDGAVAAINGYDALIFTSVNGVRFFFDRLRELRHDVRMLHGLTVVAIGPATAKAVEERGINVDIIPESYVAESVIDALRAWGIAGKRFLLARALVARDVIPDEIRAGGGTIDVVPVYRTIKPDELRQQVLDIIDCGIDAITFTSSSTVKNFFSALKPDYPRLCDAKLASIGPVTSATLRDYGLNPDVEAKEYTIPGLTAALVAAFKEHAR